MLYARLEMSDRPRSINEKSKRFVTTPHQDMTITSQVRSVLYDGGHYDLVAEQMVDGMRDIETMCRVELKKLQDRVLGLEQERAKWLTESTIVPILKKNTNADTANWVKWGTKAALTGLGGAGLTAIGFLIKFAYKGFTAP
jgi:hypothetical protein